MSENISDGYVSSRTTDKLQFDVDKVKLGNLPGLFKMIQEEGGFFKLFSTAWNNQEWDEEDNPCILDYSDNTLEEALGELHCFGTYWANPKYVNQKVSSLGELHSRIVVVTGTTDIMLIVTYRESDNIIVCYDLCVD